MSALTLSRRLSITFLALVLAVLAGCASKPKIHAIHEAGIDFTQYKTFNFLEAHTPQGEEYTSLAGKYLRAAIAKELQARGLTQAADADLLVGFNIKTKEKITSHTSPSMHAGYYGYRGGYGYSYGAGYGTETRISQYTEGTLNVDVVDRLQKQLVWEGVAIGRLKESEIKDLEGDVNEIIGLIFAKYPIPGPELTQ